MLEKLGASGDRVREENGVITYVDLGGANIDVVEKRINDEQVKQVAALKDLKVLDLGIGNFTDDALKDVGALTKLEELTIDDNDNITDAGIEHLAGLTTLKRLDVGQTAITDKALDVVSRFENLESLSVAFDAITDEGLKKLHGLKNLKIIYTQKTKASKEAKEALKAAIPGLEIRDPDLDDEEEEDAGDGGETG